MASGFEFDAVSKRYKGHLALDGASFALPQGEHTALLGPSGCGKSTALHLLAGLTAPSSGRVLLDGKVVSEPHKIVTPPHLRRVSMVFQDLALWPNLSVRENVALSLSGTRLSKREKGERVLDALTLCGIEALAERSPGNTSGGQQQRVALARALAARPSFLLLDEPFSGLDLVTKVSLLKEIKALAGKETFTILLVTHDPSEAMTLCRSAIVLEDGSVKEAGTLRQLLYAPKSETLRAFKAALKREGA